MNQTGIPCAIVRGGTSKGVFIEKRHLPERSIERDRILLAVFGSPDKRQIDGLGGADPLTSKVAIISPSDRDDADIDYTFGQVGIDTATINYNASCGNLPSGIGPFAIGRQLVKTADPVTKIRVFNTNTQKMIEVEVPTPGGGAQLDGSFSIDGVPGQGAEIRLTFHEPAGAITGRLLPTGSPADRITVQGKTIDVSIVDAGMLYAFVYASDFDCRGDESPIELQNNRVFMDSIGEVRFECARLLHEAGVIDSEMRGNLSRFFKVATVSEPPHAMGVLGRHSDIDSVHVTARIINPEKVHKAFAVTGAIAMGAARAISNTLVNKISADLVDSVTRIGHPCGAIAIKTRCEVGDTGIPTIKSCELSRTARTIMDGVVYIKPVD